MSIPVPNLQINLFEDTNIFLLSTTTDKNGVYRFSSLPEGKYTLKIKTANATFNTSLIEKIDQPRSVMTTKNLNDGVSRMDFQF